MQGTGSIKFPVPKFFIPNSSFHIPNCFPRPRRKAKYFGIVYSPPAPILQAWRLNEQVIIRTNRRLVEEFCSLRILSVEESATLRLSCPCIGETFNERHVTNLPFKSRSFIIPKPRVVQPLSSSAPEPTPLETSALRRDLE